MMKKAALIVSCLLMFAATLWATDTLSAWSKLSLARCSGRAGLRDAAPADSYQAFISVSDASAVDSLSRMGVRVLGVFEDFITAVMPAGLLQDITSMDAVRHVALAQNLHLCNDSSRFYSNVLPVHHSDGRPAALMGDGVIVGIIDTGIDFNHVNFLDENGHSRVQAVYMPEDSTGVSPVIGGCTLPGSCYETPEQIAALKADCVNSSHGTHTLGTAAGSCLANAWYGVAPRCGIVACGMPEDALTDVNVTCAVSYIFDYAARVGKPCVINMSIGSNDGPNDGTSFLCRVFESMTGPGRICVVAAGNDGNAPVCFHSSLTGVGDTVTTLLRNQSGGMQRKGYVSMWSDGPQVHQTRVVVVNRETGALEYSSPLLGVLPTDSVFSLTSDTDQAFANYYTGEIQFVSALEQIGDNDGLRSECGRYHSYWFYDVTSLAAGHLLGLQYVADEPTMLSGWCTRSAYFYTFGLDGVTGGSAVGSISDLATTDSVISVGAYCSRISYVDQLGEEHFLSGNHTGELAAFSSFGPDECGKARPDVCAPGSLVISSANRYNQETSPLIMTAPVLVDGMTYPYYVNQGTSMSAPVITGSIALMLELNPSLSVAEVREVLNRSSLKDNFVTSGDQSRWGFGKLNVDAAIDDVLMHHLTAGDVNTDGEVNIADILTIIDMILNPLIEHDGASLIRADVNHDGEIHVADINAVIELILNNNEI